MSDYLQPQLSGELRNISVLALAHVGDAVFELMVRTWLCTHGVETAKRLHGGAVEYVSARAQAAGAQRILTELSEAERSVFKRGRNAHINTIPRASSYEEYHTATGLEALFGHLYLSGQIGRLDELFRLVVMDGNS